MQDIMFKHPDGVKIIINQEDPFDVQADISGPIATPYEGGIFRVKLFFPIEFPHIPPKGYIIVIKDSFFKKYIIQMFLKREKFV